MMRCDAAHWQERLTVLAEKFDVPGASLGIWRSGEVLEAATGVLNTSTGVRTTTESVFQIGSITKVWTACLVMQLVDEGLLDLDEPVVTYLPDFRVADPDVTSAVTCRHLLAHSSGIDGDLFLDTGRGDDCVEKYVAACAELGQNHPLGVTMSYCNSGYTVLGRVIEVLRGTTWDAALRTFLSAPLGLTHTVTLPEEALLFRAATGHVQPPGGELAPAPVWGIFRSAGPAGLICSTPREVLAFAAMHLSGGTAAEGARVLSARSVEQMQVPQVEVPDKYTLGSHWGLGWILFTWGGKRVFGHDGGTIGQSAFLRVVPDSEVAVCLLTNGGKTKDLYQALFSEILAAEAGVAMPEQPLPDPQLQPADLAGYAGRYERVSTTVDVSVHEAGLRMVVTSVSNLMPEQAPPLELDLLAVEPDVFVTRMPGSDGWTAVTFFRLEDGSQLVHFGARATPKVA
ncbi:MAG: beta-lactamase family protein [Actinomycetota bacterium]|nr:beta-lactamase family protein [Actinomycetota bacterium]